MLIYAVPRLDFSGAWDAAQLFGVVWCAFALLVIAANINEILLVNEARRRQLDRIKRAKFAVWERKQAVRSREKSV
ncbi:hypothetical protein ET464_00580 [Paenibacillus protaetiae]|uniref:Uncharacterized protein n=2 Tax=Paenibacillus protaetiae TaxID=2509456 RepID=A0A4P6F0X7_9BACL|nr:hypothetical protein ET464_00580 [Paenibacillus protaetiae]